MASLYEHYLQSAMCLIEDGVENPSLNDIFSEAISLWSVRYSASFPDDFERFFDKYLSLLPKLREEALTRLHGENADTPGVSITAFTLKSGLPATKVRFIQTVSNQIQIQEHIHSGSSFFIECDGGSTFKIEPK